MKYTPKEITTNVNVSHNSPLKEFIKLFAGALVIVTLFYFIAGTAVDWAAERMPLSLEKKLSSLDSIYPCEKEETAEFKKLNHILQGYLPYLNKTEHLDYTICISPSMDVNALALPGGKIVVFQGLLHEIESPQELAFVIGHELGHFHNRDHLRGMGRSLLLLGISLVLTGADSGTSQWILSGVKGAEMKFSQSRELAADAFAVSLMKKRYGSAAGGMDFMKRLTAREKRGKLAYYFSTHPHPEIRLKKLSSQ